MFQACDIALAGNVPLIDNDVSVSLDRTIYLPLFAALPPLKISSMSPEATPTPTQPPATSEKDDPLVVPSPPLFLLIASS